MTTYKLSFYSPFKAFEMCTITGMLKHLAQQNKQTHYTHGCQLVGILFVVLRHPQMSILYGFPGTHKCSNSTLNSFAFRIAFPYFPYCFPVFSIA